MNAYVPVPRRKSPWAAALLAALVPGLGHIYLGQFPKGFTYLAGAGGLEFFGFDLDLTAVGALVGVPMEMGGLGLWIYGVVDAWRLARSRQAPSGWSGRPAAPPPAAASGPQPALPPHRDPRG